MLPRHRELTITNIQDMSLHLMQFWAEMVHQKSRITSRLKKVFRIFFTDQKRILTNLKRFYKIIENNQTIKNIYIYTYKFFLFGLFWTFWQNSHWTCFWYVSCHTEKISRNYLFFDKFWAIFDRPFLLRISLNVTTYPEYLWWSVLYDAVVW